MARTPNPAPRSAEVPINEALVRADIAALDQVAELQKAQQQVQAAELCELAALVGAAQAFDLTHKFVASATLRLFQQIRESKQIKHLPIRGADGSRRTCDSIREACPLLFGRSYDTMLREEADLETLGDEAYEAAQRLGLNRSALRAARALKPEKLEYVRTVIASGATRVEVLSIIEDLAEKVEQTELALLDARAEAEAKEQVLADKSKAIDRLKATQKRFQALPPDEQLAAMHDETVRLMRELRGGIVGRLRQAVIAIRNHGDQADAYDAFLGGVVKELIASLEDLRQEFRLPDVVAAPRPWLDGVDELPRRPARPA